MNLKYVAVLISLLPWAGTVAQPESGPTIGPAPSGRQCEWLPREETKPDAGRCGFNDISLPNPAIYDCGKSSTCEDICVFKRCNNT